MPYILEDEKSNVLNHVLALIEEHKQEIIVPFSENKLRLPTYLKSITIGELKELGATIDPDISLPESVEDRIRKYVSIKEKFREVRESFRAQTEGYYANVKKNIPVELLSKQVKDLSDEEYNLLGLHIDLMRR